MEEGGQRALQFLQNCWDEGLLADTERALIRPVGHLLPCEGAREKATPVNTFIELTRPVIPAKAGMTELNGNGEKDA